MRNRRTAVIVLAAGALLSGLALPAAAAAQSSGPATRPAVLHPGVSPQDSQNLSSSITCANWSGEIEWGGLGITGDPAYIKVIEPKSVLEDTCASGYAQFYIHYDTVDNPKTIKVIQVGPYTGAETYFSTSDSINSYKDIYVYICSEGQGGYRCGNHKGPGA